MADKEMPCRIKGCNGSWVWYGSQQIRSLGKQAPERMCEKHLEQFNTLADREIKCRTPGCAHTWIWKRGAQFSQLLRGGKMRPPSGLCASCATEERELSDRDVECKVEGCVRQWTWTRDAQMRHRLWVRRQKLKAAEEQAKQEKQAKQAAKKAAAEQAKSGEQTSEGETNAAESALSVDGQTQVTADVKAEADKAEAKADTGEAKAATADESETQAETGDKVEAKADRAEANAGESETQAETGDKAEARADKAQAKAQTGDKAGAKAEDTSEAKAAGAKADKADEAGDKSEAKPSAEKPKKKRKRKSRRKTKRTIPDEGPPDRMCNTCAAKLAAITPRQVGCKVHGCTNSWTWDRASQLRAWVHLGTDEVGVEPTAPRRMCDTCRDFCRKHPDRKLDCGRPDCEKQWMYKTGAQLQDYLAGRSLEPNRLCDECIRGGFTPAPQSDSPTAVPVLECMPCSTRGCGGTWLFVPGQKLQPWNGAGDPPDDRLCDDCRIERGLNARTAAIKSRLSPEPDGAGEVEPTEADDTAKVRVLGERETPLKVEDEAQADAASEPATDSASGSANEAVPAATETTETESSAEVAEQDQAPRSSD